MRTALFAAFVSVLFACQVSAQTNSATIAELIQKLELNAQSSRGDVIEVTDLSSAVSALLHFSGFSKEDALLALMLVHLVARGVRNTALKDTTADTSGVTARVVGWLAAKTIPPPPPKP